MPAQPLPTWARPGLAPCDPAPLRLTATAVAVAVFTTGCATAPAPVPGAAWRVEPLLDVRHSERTSEQFYTLGRYHDGLRAYEAAIGAYRDAVRIDEHNVEAWNALGVAQARIGRHTEAQQSLRRALDIDPERAHVLNNLGQALLLAGQPQEALVPLHEALRRDPGNRIARENLRLATARAASAAPAATVPAAMPAAGLVELPLPITRIEMPSPPSGTTEVPAPMGGSAELPLPLASVAPAARPAPAEALGRPVAVVDTPTLPDLSVSTVAGVSPMTPAARAEERAAPLPLAATPLAQATTGSAATGLPATVAAGSATAAGASVTAPLTQTLSRKDRSRIELSNGNGIPRAATQLRRWLEPRGVAAQRLTNQRPYLQAQTLIQYRPGHEGEARRLAEALPLWVPARLVENTGLARSDVRLVLGRDWQQAAACIQRDDCAPQVAQAPASGASVSASDTSR